MAGKKNRAVDSTTEKKRKLKDSSDGSKTNKKPYKRNKTVDRGVEKRKKRTGPRLPSSLRKALEVKSLDDSANISDENIESDEANDFYEYDEPLAEEESRKNRRYDTVENYEYQLPEQIEVCALFCSHYVVSRLFRCLII